MRRTWRIQLLAGWTTVLVILMFWITHGTLVRLLDSAHGECVRVQILRDQVNQGQRVIHDVLETVGNHETGPAGRAYLHYAREVKFIPATDCTAAINHPTTYKPPQPHSFPEIR